MEQVEAIEAQPNLNWSESVEDLVSAGDTDGAISLLETVVSKLETLSPSETLDLQLASALTELSKLHSTKHFSLKSDELLSRASLLKQRVLQSRPSGSENVEDSKEDVSSTSNATLSSNHSVIDGRCIKGNLEESGRLPDDASPCNGSSDDDWEAIVDRAPSELLSPQGLPSISNLSLNENKVQGPKRRGRGTFSYKQDKLYSDRQSCTSFSSDTEDDDLSKGKQQNPESIYSKYGTHHVLVLSDFPPSTRTIELEKLFQDFRSEFVIRWVNDTMALAVFQTPSLDLEPPRRRPQTSTRTAQRLIAQGMGMKLPSTNFGSRELKDQEEARKNRIVTRQKMIEDAWGDGEK
ncbi:uncharacterized protein LOC110626570 isoform X2 [Manihot esculenta]|uniref:Uncharacterized protein n=1 Tax=Manihot esculenta TaxID=3983 RepID=A0ACB7GZL5_MANES|nr:uncharacterized protein LOC110626570 isoform X2 [Manihot esculenta]KAG8644126.1 hypothetical protein MANES_11G101400v8 [Manihot esculenta]